jgi:hypothetical protein
MARRDRTSPTGRRLRPNQARDATARTRQLFRMIRSGLGAAQSLSIAQMVMAAAAQFGVDPALALAVAQRESGLNPNLVNSQTGAAGVMQLMPATARSLGVTNSLDPTQNIPAGVRYLAQMLNRYDGDTAKGIAAYDWGPGNLDRALTQYGDNWLFYAPTETQNYVAALTGQTPSQTAGSPVSGPSSPSPVTIDASTGEPIDSGVDVSQLPVINDQGVVSTPSALNTGTLLGLTAAGVGLWLATEFFFG